MFKCAREGGFVKVRPQDIEKQELRVSRLPQKEIGEPNFARGADQKVQLRQVACLEFGRDRCLVDCTGRELAPLHTLTETSSCLRDLGLRPVIQRHDQGQSRITLSLRNSTFKTTGHLWSERCIVPNQLEPDTFVDEPIELTFEIEFHQCGKVGDFTLTAL